MSRRAEPKASVVCVDEAGQRALTWSAGGEVARHSLPDLAPSGDLPRPGVGKRVVRLVGWLLGDEALLAEGDRLVVRHGVTGEALRQWKAHSIPVRLATLSGDRKRAATTAGKSVRIWDLSSGAELGAKGTRLRSQPETLALHPTAPWLVHTCRDWVCVDDLRTGRTEWGQSWTPNLASSLAISPDGEHFALGGRAGNVRRFPLGTSRAKDANAAHEGPVSALLFGPSGASLLSASGAEVKVWDAESMKQVGSWTAPGPVAAAALVDGRAMLMGDRGEVFMTPFALDG